MAKRKISSISELNAVRGYLTRINAEVTSMRKAVRTVTQGGYKKETTIIRFGRDGSVSAPDMWAPTKSEQEDITKEFEDIQFPSLQTCENLTGRDIPDDIREAHPDNIYEFRDIHGRITMVQLRVEMKNGKEYIPWTYWDDGEWRKMEPDGYLPMWGMDAIKDQSTVFIHEGAKAARAVRWMVEKRSPAAEKALSAHPWGQELQGAAHVGWIGGAHRVLSTDWSLLRKSGVTRAYIVSDNDRLGIHSLPHISREINIQAYHIQFTDEWPSSFDLADPFPESMFGTLDGVVHYKGPSFREVTHPATWATDQIPQKKGKPINVLRETFKDSWAYVEEIDLYVCLDRPEIQRSEEILNKRLKSLSHTGATASLINGTFTGRTIKVAYRPDLLAGSRIVTDGGTSAINLHVPTSIRSVPGNPKPFLDFLEYMIPIPEERKLVERWTATLIARPDIRMLFALLLVSETQGVGKTTFCSDICAPLVGEANTSWPSEDDIANSQFNQWMTHKRLIVVNEIYSGHSWKAYNKLKSVITDKQVQVNQKYQRQYTLDNWSHVIACSNSSRALRMEIGDRRWFYPKVTEKKWPDAKFAAFQRWLKSGGLSIIKHWAENYGDYIQKGEAPPSTERKAELIAASRSEGAMEAVTLGEALTGLGRPAALAMRDIVQHVRNSAQGKTFESDADLRKAMHEAGCITLKERVKIGNRMQPVIMNRECYDIVSEMDDASERLAHIRGFLITTASLFETAM